MIEKTDEELQLMAIELQTEIIKIGRISWKQYGIKKLNKTLRLEAKLKQLGEIYDEINNRDTKRLLASMKKKE